MKNYLEKLAIRVVVNDLAPRRVDFRDLDPDHSTDKMVSRVIESLGWSMWRSAVRPLGGHVLVYESVDGGAVAKCWLFREVDELRLNLASPSDWRRLTPDVCQICAYAEAADGWMNLETGDEWILSDSI